MTLPDLSHLVQDGALLQVRVTPKARRTALQMEGEVLRAQVTAPPDKGKANAAVQALLAQAMGLAKSRLVLVRGHTSRDKCFRIEL
ncbi:DUF167 domain-containing protein [Pseudoponticoccus marisrubri]|uniref:UPF0235 protein AVJ23_14305 n=1 Tax=Pseudoponticoccus marisrubri TaxID=1685382 RepID=A0A0W7WI02_9RHOB|nr:DUF167 domain-containing protein [Pseudoponticoccus marisrubri]KUF10210.1 hypothetical protein AVJ23_14305 [Pseudoponticoccus marisrubri]